MSIGLENKQAWLDNAMLWETYEPPIRPSQGELLIYDLAMATRAGSPYSKRALVLGDSPELRDLLARHKYHTTVVANDFEAIIAMNQLLEYKGERQEKVVIMNWQDMDFADQTFDIIVSDWGLNSLPYWRDYTMVFDKVNRQLKFDGLFLTRMNIYRPEKVIRNVSEIMLDWQKSKNDKFSYLLELEMYSNISNYNPDSFQINLGEFYRDSITKAYYQKEMSFADWQEFHYPFFTMTLTYPKKEAVDELLNKFFTVTAERYGSDYGFSNNEPIYICKK